MFNFVNAFAGPQDATYLRSEGYDVSYYDHDTTLTDFVSMAKASVIVIITHGYESGNSPANVIGLDVQIGANSPHGAALIEKAYKNYIKEDHYSPSWLGLHVYVNRYTGTFNKTYGPPLIYITTAGIHHFFAGKHIALVEAMTCESMHFANDFDADSYFGYKPIVKCGRASGDNSNLFDRLTGEEGVDYRTTVEAWNKQGFADDGFSSQLRQSVVLSPAVTSVSPAANSVISPGTTTTYGSIAFDAKMNKAHPESVVRASGCDATTSDEKWNAGGTELSFDLKVPKDAPEGQITLTVPEVRATAANKSGDLLPPDELSGNHDGTEAMNGVAPNGNDYTWRVSCVRTLIPKGCPLTSAAASKAFGGPAVLVSSSDGNGGFPGCTYGRAGYIDDAASVLVEPGSKENFQTYLKNGWTPVAGIGQAAAIDIGSNGSVGGNCVVLTKKSLAMITLRLASAPGDAGVIVLPSFSDMQALCADVAGNIS